MKIRIFAAAVAAAVLFCGCEKQSDVVFKNVPFGAVVEISTTQDVLKYALDYNGEAYRFTALGGDMPIEFCYADGKYVTLCKGIESQQNVEVLNPPTSIVKAILSLSFNVAVMPDRSGKCTIYSVGECGEYSLEISSDGLPIALKVPAMGLSAEFSEVSL